MRRRLLLTALLLVLVALVVGLGILSNSIRNAPLQVGQGRDARLSPEPSLPPSTMQVEGEIPVGAPPFELAFASNRDGDWDIYLLKPDGTLSNLSDEGAGAHDYFPSWSLDGAQINFLASRGTDGEMVPTQVKADGTGLRTLSIVEAVFTLVRENRFDWDGNWSQTDGRLLWASLRDFNLELYSIASGADFVIANATRLTNDAGRDWFPRWSPDGSTIAFSSDRRGNEDIYRISAQGGEAQALTDSPWDDVRPMFNRDGTQVIYYHDAEDAQLKAGKLNLYGVDSAGGTAQALDGSPLDMDFLSSPDGTWWVYASNQTGTWQLYVARSDGSEVRRITDGQGDALFAAWRP